MIKWLTKFKKEIHLGVILLLFSYPILGLRIPVILIAILLIWALSDFKNIKENLSPYFFLFLAFPFLYLLQFLINPTPESSFIIEKKISLFLIPIIFLALPKGLIKKGLPELAFVSATSILILVSSIYLLFIGINPAYEVGGTSFAIRKTIEDLIDIHPTYLALVVTFSALILTSKLILQNLKLNNLLVTFGIVIHILFVFILASRIGLIGLIVSIVFLGFYHRKILKSKVYLTIISILLIGITSWFVPSSNERIKELINSLPNTEQQAQNGTNIRHSIFYCSSLLVKENWFWGIGTGHIQQHLNTCYFMIGSPQLVEVNYNTHNEFLNIWLGIGLIGLLVFGFILFGSFYSVKGNDIHLVFLLLFCIFCLTENLLERQMGILYFVIWNSYFMMYNPKVNEGRTS